MLDWLIIGGGIHGVHLAARLVAAQGVNIERLAILDPGEALLERWKTCTAATGMTHLRSPSVHHLDLKPWSLQRFAGKRKMRSSKQFAAPYDRPALDLFNAHCDQVVQSFDLAQSHIRDRATRCDVDCDGVTVTTASGSELSARSVILAIGNSEQPFWPEWAPTDHPRVHHIFGLSDEARREAWSSGGAQSIAVIGGGISAGQAALKLSAAGHTVHLVSRHGFRKHQFDSDPGWLGPKSMNAFWRVRDHDHRRTMITKARHRGSVPPDLNQSLRWAIDKGHVIWHQTGIGDLAPSADGVTLSTETGDALNVQHVLLATGFEGQRPGGTMVDELVHSARLPCASCGYPIVDQALRWHPRVHVSGPLAELELGPSARNIAGARRAGDRIVKHLASG